MGGREGETKQKAAQGLEKIEPFACTPARACAQPGARVCSRVQGPSCVRVPTCVCETVCVHSWRVCALGMCNHSVALGSQTLSQEELLFSHSDIVVPLGFLVQKHLKQQGWFLPPPSCNGRELFGLT